MQRPRSSVSKNVVRMLTLLGVLSAAVFSVSVPLVYGIYTIEGLRTALRIETTQVGRNLEQIVLRQPELWAYETLRIQTVIDAVSLQGHPEDRTVRTSDGRLVAKTATTAQGPTLRWVTPIHDSGRVVAYLEARRSIRGLLLRSLLIAGVSTSVGWGLFVIFRLLPLRSLKQAVGALSDERHRLAATLQAIADGIIAVDGDDKVIFLNPAAEAFLGYSWDKAVGKPLAEVYPVTVSVVPGSTLTPNRAQLHRVDGSPRTIEEHCSWMPSDMGLRQGRVIVFRDITQQLETEAELLRAHQLESLGVLAGGIAHDFNNVLSAILGNVTLAMQDLPPAGKASQRLEQAVKATDRARNLSMKLLTFAKGGDPSRRVMDVVPLIREAADLVTHDTSVEVSFEFQPDHWGAFVDDGLFSQVIQNLVLNGVQAMQHQGRIQINIENLDVVDGDSLLLSAGPYLCVSIQDSGPGIPRSILRRIFEPYFTTKDVGVGLGLASCFNIVKAHGGTIHAESEPGQGALFRVYVPATGQVLDRQPEPAPTSPPLERVRVLVMEDDPILQEIALEMLERSGFEAHSCPDGTQAVQAYTQALKEGAPYRVVLMDLTIPGGMGGLEAAGHILDLDPEACLIVSSGYSVDPVMAQPKQFGFKDVLPKPYSLRDLLEVLNRVIPGQSDSPTPQG